MKQLLIAVLSLSFLVTVAEAGGSAAGNAKAKEKAKEKEKEKEVRERRRVAVEEVLKAKDKNHDGSLTMDEYLTGEADAAAATQTFEKFNKNKDRSLSKDEIAASLGM